MNLYASEEKFMYFIVDSFAWSVIKFLASKFLPDLKSVTFFYVNIDFYLLTSKFLFYSKSFVFRTKCWKREVNLHPQWNLFKTSRPTSEWANDRITIPPRELKRLTFFKFILFLIKVLLIFNLILVSNTQHSGSTVTYINCFETFLDAPKQYFYGFILENTVSPDQILEHLYCFVGIKQII